MSARQGLVAGAAMAAAMVVMVGCGTTPAHGGAHGAMSGGRGLPLATSLGGTAGTSWAVVQMGGSRAQENNFWQLFARPAGAAKWRLATPAGVADNGGLVVAGTGARSLVAGFRPSQDLTFSPLAATADEGTHWSPGSLVSPGLANVPDALAAGPGGQLIALTDTGEAELGTRLGAAWAKLSSQESLARTPAGRACGLAGLTAAAFTATGTPLLAGACGTPGTAGIFALRGGAWRLAGPALPAFLARSDVEVLALVTAGARTTAVLIAGQGVTAGVIAAWSDDGGNHWTLSPELRTGAGRVRSASLWAGGSAGLVLTGGRGRTIAGPAASWRSLPSLPTGTATLAMGPTGQLDALVAVRGTLSAWQLRAGAAGWSQRQAIQVAIPYGSSG